MKPKQFLMISLSFCLGLAACRSKRNQDLYVPPKQNEQETFSSAPPLQPEQYRNTRVSEIDAEHPVESPSSPKHRELSSDELILRINELKRNDLFNVPISDQAAKDRAQAWEKLTSPVYYVTLKKEQYLYAQELLERYRDAPVLERLVFWRLLDLRLHEQGVSSSSRIVGDDYRDLRNGMYPKLKALLYSAIGEDSAKLPDYLAARKGIEMLKAASPNGSLFDY